MTEHPPIELYRIDSIRIFGKERIHHVGYWATEEGCQGHVKWIKSAGHELLSVTKYILAKNQPEF